MSSKWVKKPVVVEAVLLEKHPFSIIDAVKFMSNADMSTSLIGTNATVKDVMEQGGLIIPTLEGNLKASFGDYIIKGIKGEFYPCKPDIFHATYERQID